MDHLRQELMRLAWAFAALLIAAVACSDGQAATRRAVSPAVGVVDSVLPAEVALARFVDGLPRPATLGGSADSPAQLIRQFLDAASRGDSAMLLGLVVSRAEYGFFYYPTSVYSRKPYELSPDVAWLLSSAENAKGIRRAVRRLRGRAVSLGGFDCDETRQEGPNVIYSGCSVSVVVDGSIKEERMFRSLMEREGRFKFLSYASDI